MNEIQKQNDILVASLSNPNATTLDLLLNNINASNTSLLTPDEYKSTPFILKVFTDLNGVFNDQAFLSAYLLANQKYGDLLDENLSDELSKELEYSPTDRFAPAGAKVMDVSVDYKKIANPLQQAYGLEGVGIISNPTISRKEAAQHSKIFDPHTNSFIEYSAESLPLYKKVFGETLVYATWDEDGTHIDPATGETIQHKKDEWKKNSDGDYYTEYINGREIGRKEVVNLQDILTDENSSWNSIDFMDSDGLDKSVFGTVMKSAVTIAPYFIPGFNKYWAALTTTFGLASVLPTFYKSIDSLITGEPKDGEYTTINNIESWYKKFDPSTSSYGSLHFFSVESLGNLVVDTLAQLYQLKAVAKAATSFLKEAPSINNINSVEKLKEWKDYWKKSNALARGSALGYMSLISAADIYNDTLNAGYDARTAGLASLLSAGALFGVMNFNETANGISTWFLDKESGVNKLAEASIIRSMVKEKAKPIQEALKQALNGDKRSLLKTITDFKRTAYSKLDDLSRQTLGSTSLKQNLQNALSEGLEEVSEEVIQDTIKGIIDTMSYLGLTSKEGSFGGWDNVFSLEGLTRYAETFVGGALGGSIFDIHNSILNKNVQKQSGVPNQDFINLVANGYADEIKKEISKCKKFWNDKQSVNVYEYGDKKIHLSNSKDTLADVIQKVLLNQLASAVSIVNEGKELASTTDSEIKRRSLRTDVYKKWGYEKYEKEVFDEDFKNFTEAKAELLKLLNDKKEGADVTDTAILEQEKLVEEKSEELKKWANGEKHADLIAEFSLLVNRFVPNTFYLSTFEEEDIDSLGISLLPILNISKAEFAKRVYDVDYELLKTSEKNSDLINEIDSEYTYILTAVTKENLHTVLPRIKRFKEKLIPLIGKDLKEIVKSNDLDKFFEGYELKEPIIFDGNYHFLKNTELSTLSDVIQYDLFSSLIKDKVIEVSGLEGDELEEFKNTFNSLVESSGINVWSNKALSDFIRYINALFQKDNPNQLEPLKIINIDNASGRTKFAKIYLIIDNIKKDNKTSINNEYYNIISVLHKQISNRFKNETEAFDKVNSILKEEGLSINDKKEFLSKKIRNIDDESGAVTGLIADLDGYKNDFINYVKDNSNAELLIGAVKKRIFKGKDYTYEELLLIHDAFLDFLITRGNKTIEDKIDSHNQLRIMNDLALDSELQSILEKHPEMNPIYSLLQKLLPRVGVDSQPLIDWLVTRQTQVADSQESLVVPDVTIPDLELAKRLIDGLRYIVEDTRINAKTGIDSFDRIMLEYWKGRKESPYKDEDLEDLFPLLSDKDVDYLHLTLANILNKIDILLDYTKNEKKGTYELDKMNRSIYIKLALDFLSSGIKINEKTLLEKFDVDVDDDKQELLLYSKMNEFYSQCLKYKEEYLQKIEEASLKKQEEINFNKIIFEGILKAASNNAEKEVEFLKEKDSLRFDFDLNLAESNSKQMSFRTRVRLLLNSFAYSPIDLLKKYKDVILDSNLIPRFDQEQTLFDSAIHILNQDVISQANEYLYSQLSLGLRDKKILNKNIIFISGSTGSGKSTLIPLITKMVGAEKVRLMAVSKDLSENLNKNKVSEGVLYDDDNTDINKYMLDINQLIEELINNSLDLYQKTILNNTEGGNSREFKESYSLNIQINNVTYELGFIIKGTKLVIHNISLDKTDKTIATIQSIADKIQNQRDGNFLNIIDEATFLNPIAIEILNQISRKNSVVLLGDKNQNGFNATISSWKFALGITNSFCTMSPSLKGSVRSGNSLVTHNQKILSIITDAYDKIDTLDPKNWATQISHVFKNNEFLFHKQQLKGIQFESDTDNVNSILKQIKEKIADKSIKSFLVIAEKENLVLTKQRLINLGFDESLFQNETIKIVDPVGALGSESDAVFIYLIKSNNKLINSDYDFRLINTLLTRNKLFTIVETMPKEANSILSNDLFLTYGVLNNESLISEDLTLVLEKVRDLNLKRIILIKEIIENIDTTGVQNGSGNEAGGKNKIQDNQDFKEINESLRYINENQEYLENNKLITEIEGYIKFLLKLTEEQLNQQYQVIVAKLNNYNSALLKVCDDISKKKASDSDFSWDNFSSENPYKNNDEIQEERKRLADNVDPHFTDAVHIYLSFYRLGIKKSELHNFLNGEGSVLEKVKDLLDQYKNNRFLDFIKYLDILNSSPELNFNVTPQDLLTDFIKLKDKAVENVEDYMFVFKTMDQDRDWAYLKMNDDGSWYKYPVTNFIVSTIQVKGLELPITIGKAGYAKDNSVYTSETYSNMFAQAKKELEENPDSILYIKYNQIGSNYSQSKAILHYGSYYNYRKGNSGEIQQNILDNRTLKDLAGKGIFPISCGRSFKIKNNLSNKELLFMLDNNSDYSHKISRDLLENMGYVCDLMTISSQDLLYEEIGKSIIGLPVYSYLYKKNSSYFKIYKQIENKQEGVSETPNFTILRLDYFYGGTIQEYINQSSDHDNTDVYFVLRAIFEFNPDMFKQYIDILYNGDKFYTGTVENQIDEKIKDYKVSDDNNQYNPKDIESFKDSIDKFFLGEKKGTEIINDIQSNPFVLDIITDERSRYLIHVAKNYPLAKPLFAYSPEGYSFVINLKDRNIPEFETLNILKEISPKKTGKAKTLEFDSLFGLFELDTQDIEEEEWDKIYNIIKNNEDAFDKYLDSKYPLAKLTLRHLFLDNLATSCSEYLDQNDFDENKILSDLYERSQMGC